jgi:hypothetical protein
MIVALSLSLLITSAVITGVALFVRWAIREGEGDDPRWGLTGQLDAASPLIGFAERAFAIPEVAGLTLRGSRRREAAWEQRYSWSGVSIQPQASAVILSGPFGSLTCPVPEGTSLEEVARRFAKAAPIEPSDGTST